jgi:transcription-repair coupling factor (superfamily II helicase)
MEQKKISGLVGSAAAFVLARLREQFANILIITSSSAKAEMLKAETALFTNCPINVFPAPDTVPGEGIKPSKELVGERQRVLAGKGLIIAPVKAVMWQTSRRLEEIRLLGNQGIRLEDLLVKLIEFGYHRFDIVGERGEFSVRGGIVDVFPLNSERPLRLEFSGDKIESLREYDPYSQRSIRKLDQAVIFAAEEGYEVPVFTHLGKDWLIVFDELLEISRVADQQIEEQRSFPGSLPYLTLDKIQELTDSFSKIEFSSFLNPGEEPEFSSPPSYINKLNTLPAKAEIFSRHAQRLREELNRPVSEGSLRGGFIFQDREIISDRELFGEEQMLHKVKPASAEGVADELLADLKKGDYVVHENYGIARFQGMTMLAIEGVNQEYLLLEFDHGDQVFVPPSQAGLVEKYSSGSDLTPRLSRLGTMVWTNKKRRVKKALKDMTEELLKLYAARQKLPAFAFPADDIWQKELADTFPYEETPDQRKAIIETKRDLEALRPMDRLICGDVGYGKTEVAIRAAAKVVAAGKQVAILVPTTILAEQHFNNFADRFKNSPFVVEMLSRFRSKKEQATIVNALAIGGVDILIGTHRLLSKDIKFKDLGLLIIDEEQRFGVGHKEKLKKLKETVDTLTLSATPIPRTLYLSLSGARDMSVITTPPVDRSPIRTYVLPWSEAVISEAIRREIDRGGQVYFLHNFVESIEGIAVKIKRLVPQARVTIGHGQMSAESLEKTMISFLDRKYDVLVCTSIIESGLDITNVNTILIDQADRFGLSQLYQIRGRVGRSAVRAYAYLFYHPDKIMTDQAVERLKAIQEFTALGSGYKLARRDLEIRGAGNLLGAEQSGHIEEIGFDLYCELLEQAVKEVKGIKEISPREVVIDLKIEAFIPEDYVKDERQRIALYRRMNLVSNQEEIKALKLELRDRFGAIPEKLEELFIVLALRVGAFKAGVKSVKESNGQIIIEKMTGKKIKIEIKGLDKIKLVERYIGG